MPPPRAAHHDPALHATVVSRTPMRYRGGADSTLDRPAHVRAGSSITWVAGRLVLIQDDANFLAMVDPGTGLTDAIALPAGKDGLRQFDDLRGNKKFKLDLESCCTIPGVDGTRFVALGSGSKRRRRRIVCADGLDQHAEPSISIVDADALYLALEATADFAGSDMNIEGALAVPGALRLFGRGNGEARGGRVPLNATCDLPLSILLAYLDDPNEAPAPTPAAIRQYALGAIDDVALGFTDAALCGDVVVYTATAERSTRAADDGEMVGSVLGVLPTTGALRYARLTDARGRPLRDKVEGVAPVPGVTDRVFVVIDADNPSEPSELCEVRLDGVWR